MSDPAVPPSVPPQGATPPSKLKKLLTKIAIALGLALLVFLIGLFVGRGPVGDLQERAEQAETHLALMQDHQHMTEAAMLLYRTALDLDARNFGTANDRLDESASVLELVGPAGSEFESLRTSVAAMDINVAQDLAGQRAAVLGFAETLQSIMPSVEEMPIDDAASSDTSTQEQPAQ